MPSPPSAPAERATDNFAADDNSLELSFIRRPSSTLLARGFTDADLLLGCWDDQPASADATRSSSSSTDAMADARTKDDRVAGDSKTTSGPRGSTMGLELDLDGMLLEMTVEGTPAAPAALHEQASDSTPVRSQPFARPPSRSQRRRTPSPPCHSRKTSLSSAPTSPRMGSIRWGSMSAALSSSSETALGPAFSLHSGRSASISGQLSLATQLSIAPTDGGNEGRRSQDSLTAEDALEEGTARSTSTTTSGSSLTNSDALPPTPSSPTASSHSSSHDGEILAFSFPLPPVAFGPSLDGALADLPSTPPPPRKATLPSGPCVVASNEPRRIPTIPIGRKLSVNRSSPLSPAGAAARSSTAAAVAASSASAPVSPRLDRPLAPNMRRTTSANNHQEKHNVGGSPLPPPSGLPPAPPPPTQPLTLPARTYNQKVAHSTSSTSSGPMSPLDGFGLIGMSPVTSPTSSASTSSGSRGFRSPKSSKSAGNGGGGGGGGWSQLLSAFPRSASKTSLGPSGGQGSIRSTRSDSSDRAGGILSSFGSHRQSHASSSSSTAASSQPMGLSFSADPLLASSHPYAKRSSATPSGRLSDPPSSADSFNAQRRESKAQQHRTERNAGGAPQLALVIAETDGDNNGYKCPVCVERIGAEFRMKGEKPDVIPECGHAIHHDCFVHVYGPLPERNRFGDMRKPQSFGVCGVCRKSMKVGESGAAGNISSGKASKLAALTGMQSMSAPPPPLLVPSGGAGSGSGSFLEDSDGDDNDPIDPLVSGSSSTRSGQSDHVVRYEASSARIVVPSITVLPEYRNVVRGRPGAKTTVTAVVVFEVPERAPKDEPEPSLSGRSLRGTRSEMSLRPNPSGLPAASRGVFGDPRADTLAISHTPVDILLILSLASPSTATSSTAFKTRVIRSSLAFIMSKMGAKDRLSIVTYESGQDGVIRKTPFLAVGRDGDGRRKLLDLVVNMGSNDDRYIVPLHREERSDVVSAVNVALDVLLQRKTRNPISGVALVCDSADAVNRSQMDLVIARAEAAAVPIHSIGFGKAHDPSPLWLISNHTAGDYTFVPEWNDLQESLAGVIGGIMSIAMTQVKLHLSTQDPSFRFAKVCGPLNAILPPDGKTIDIELRDLCHGERKEILVEMELLAPGFGTQKAKGGTDDEDEEDDVDSRAGDWASENGGGGRLGSVGMAKSASSRSSAGQRSPACFRDSVAGHSDANHLGDAMFGANATIDEVPCLELDCSFFDPLCSKACTRLARPLLLQLTLLPHTASPNSGSSAAPETIVVRRRMELLASDMISRALIFISKTRRFEASLNLLEETRHVLQGKIDDLVETIGRDSATSFGKSAKRAARTAVNRSNLATLEAIMLDLGALVEGFDDDSWVDFNREQKNFGAQQAMILRSQRAWTPRSEIERLYFTSENAIDLVRASSLAPRD